MPAVSTLAIFDDVIPVKALSNPDTGTVQYQEWVPAFAGTTGRGTGFWHDTTLVIPAKAGNYLLS
ncbi:hypothetical protein E4T54_08145 [Legionella geestiana]|nr:hypothetical protein E4T54_08145 [Legionella geestiana]